MIIQTDDSLRGWGAVCKGVQTSGQWSEEERIVHINVLEPLAIISIHFQIDNKAALSYLLKVGETKNEQMIKLSKEIWHYLLNHNVYHSKIPAFSTEYSSRQGIKEKNRPFRVAFSFQGFSSSFLTTRFSDNRFCCSPPMPSTTFIYTLPLYVTVMERMQ